MHAYHIDSLARTIVEVTYQTLADMQAYVGGSIESAWRWPNGDTLYVDEDGLSKPGKGFFWLADRTDQPLVGNALVVGAETMDRHGHYIDAPRPAMPLEYLHRSIRWTTREQVDSWAKAHASEPAITVGSDVVTRVGRLFGGIPR